MVNLHHLRGFYHVAKSLSFTKAAGELYISQPAVTKQVKALEGEWDLKLFSKRGAKTILSEEGKVLFEYAKRMFEYEKEIELAAEELKNLERGVLHLGAPRTFKFIMSFLMDIFHKEYPGVRIQFVEGSAKPLTESLLKQRTEIALLAKVEDHPSIRFIHFSQQEVSFVVSPTHHLAQKEECSLAELAEEPIIVRAAGSGTRKLVMDSFEQQNFKPNILLETNNYDFIKDVVLRGEAGTFLTEAEIDSLAQEEELIKIPVKDHKMSLKIYVAYSTDRPLSLPARTFLECLGRLDQVTKPFPYLAPTWPDDFPFTDDNP